MSENELTEADRDHLERARALEEKKQRWIEEGRRLGDIVADVPKGPAVLDLGGDDDRREEDSEAEESGGASRGGGVESPGGRPGEAGGGAEGDVSAVSEVPGGVDPGAEVGEADREDG